MAKTSKPDRRKITLAVTEKMESDMAVLVEEHDFSSMSELLRRSLNAYKILLDCQRDGGSVCLVDAEGNETWVTGI